MIIIKGELSRIEYILKEYHIKTRKTKTAIYKTN